MPSMGASATMGFGRSDQRIGTEAVAAAGCALSASGRGDPVFPVSGTRSAETDGMKLLIVDSSSVARRQLFVPLRTAHQVQEAVSRDEALALLDRFAPDVVIAGPFEPGDPDETTGLAWVQRLQSHPSRPFILIITRNDRKDVAARLLRLGVLDVLPKPADVDEVRMHLKRAERLR